MKLVKLFERGSRAVVIECIPGTGVPSKVRQIEEVAGVSSVHEDFGLLGEYLAPSFTQESCCVFEIRLEVPRRRGLCREQEYMCASGLAAANDERKVQAADFLHEPFVVERVLIDVDAAPDAGVVSANGDDPQ